jgi:AcrR family transcriptional regulator
VDAALGLLDREPRESLTAARVAAAVDAVPAALYRHFESIDDLFDEVLARILQGIEVDPSGESRWEGQLSDWMSAVRRQLLRYPALGPLIGRLGRTSPAWLEVCSVPVEILRRAGVGARDLSGAHLWICELTIALAIQEASLPLDDQIRGARASLGRLSARSRARLEPLLSGPARIKGDRFFAFVVERTVDGVKSLARPRRGARSA